MNLLVVVVGAGAHWHASIDNYRQSRVVLTPLEHARTQPVPLGWSFQSAAGAVHASSWQMSCCTMAAVGGDTLRWVWQTKGQVWICFNHDMIVSW
jgi:hypothetical protein